MAGKNGQHTNGKPSGNGGAPEPDREARVTPQMGQATTGKVADKAKAGAGSPIELPVLTKKDFTSDQETRWCPGCGDYAILASVQGLMPSLGIPPHRMVFVSGIGCAGRFSYYMDTYGMHGIHGRAPALATGIATARRDLSVWVVSGDGDSLSIGGNHLIHALRRNVPLKILLFNNQIYGLTKGQYSPTSEEGKVTKSTPFGSQDHPFNPVSLALGAEATFVARTVDVDKQHLTQTLEAAARHEGTAFVEIYQNCNVFNDGAFDAVRDKDQRAVNQIRLEHGKPIRFGADGERGVARGAGGRLELVNVADVGEDALIVHDAEREDAALAFELAQLAHQPTGPTPVGVFRSVSRPVYAEAYSRQLSDNYEQASDEDLDKLLCAGHTWSVE
jgi:2-oxoglutarate/2-oxoacid ferredoxin oxidoreductase subunit beta